MPVGFIIPRVNQQKPSLGAQLDYSHPLAQYIVRYVLFNEGSGLLLNPAMNRSETTIENMAVGVATGLTGWASCPAGIGLGINLSTAASSKMASGNGNAIRLNRNFSFFSQIFYKTLGRYNIGTDGASGWNLICNNASGQLQVGKNGVAGILNSAANIAANVLNHVGFTIDNNGLVSLYINGRLDSSTTTVLAFDTSVGKTFDLGSSTDGVSGTAPSYVMLCASFFNTALTAVEVAQLYAEPYAMFLPTGPRKFYSFVYGFRPMLSDERNSMVIS